jgi:amino acid transporter
MKKKIFLVVALLALIFNVNFAMAQEESSESETAESVAPSNDFKEGMESQTDALLESSGIDPTISAENVVASIINMVLSLLAVLFVVLIIVSGYQWMTAGGNEEQVKKAQSRIKNAIIGLIIIVAAYAITAFVFQNLPGGGGVGDQSEPGSSTVD